MLCFIYINPSVPMHGTKYKIRNIQLQFGFRLWFIFFRSKTPCQKVNIDLVVPPKKLIIFISEHCFQVTNEHISAEGTKIKIRQFNFKWFKL